MSAIGTHTDIDGGSAACPLLEGEADVTDPLSFPLMPKADMR